uniref:Uncharacterized protein n=1 Tax=Lygus hesperus TaxID=30085 RepID=A0A146LFN6_LYGHE
MLHVGRSCWYGTIVPEILGTAPASFPHGRTPTRLAGRCMPIPHVVESLMPNPPPSVARVLVTSSAMSGWNSMSNSSTPSTPTVIPVYRWQIAASTVRCTVYPVHLYRAVFPHLVPASNLLWNFQPTLYSSHDG